MIQPDLGLELRRRREAAGLSLARLAALTHYDKGYLSKVEHGKRAPSVQLVRLCDTVLEANGALTGRLDQAAVNLLGSADAASGPGHGDGTQLGHASPSPVSQPYAFNPVSSTDPAPLGWTRHRARLQAAAGTGAVLADFRTMLGTLRRTAQCAPAALTIRVVETQVVALRQLAAWEQDERLPALRLAARYAEYAGWLAQECGDAALAGRWTQDAAALSVTTGDQDLPAYALVRHAELALYRQDARTTLDLATMAGEYPRAAGRVRAMAAHRAAQGYALAGETRACEAALDRAATMLADPGTEEPADTVLGPSSTGDLGGMVAGWCYVDLGQPRRAADLLMAALSGVPPRAWRARAIFGARLAQALLAAGELDEGCVVTADVLRLADATRSASALGQLRVLSRELQRSHRHPLAREVRRDLLAVLHPARTAR